MPKAIKKASKPKKLSPRRQRFVDNFLIEPNATQAAIKAGYSEASAYNQADRLMKNDDVKEVLKTSMLARSQRLQVRADDVLRSWVLMFSANIADYLDKDGMIRLKGVTREQMYAVTEYQTDTTTDSHGQVHVKAKIKLCDRLKATEMAARHSGLFEEDNRQKAPVGAGMSQEEVETRILELKASIDAKNARKASLIDIDQYEDAEFVDQEPQEELLTGQGIATQAKRP